MGIKRPATKREQLRKQILIAAHEGLRQAHVDRFSLVDGYLRGFVRIMHDNTAGSNCYGMAPHFHTHFYTNHDKV